MADCDGPTQEKQRLVLCLDGTWNNRHASTNVFHLYNLVVEGTNLNGCRQRKHYLEGVGTGVLDRVSGGGFGFGLEENVRRACDWLIEHYNDGDEIFLFGFSRGAFTARSLVGFLSRLGLLTRGAPLSLNELWQAYRILGRAEDDRANWWERAFGREKRTVRPLVQLPFAPQTSLTPTEKLLVQWSRRVPIKCLGVFDTVGAMGLDALAIPGVRGNMGAFHSMNLTTLIENGFHALALDEHRSPFMHTPMSEYIPASHEHSIFAERIHQRWFAGSHSNVGGGYESNPSTLLSLRWMAEEVEKLGLVLESKAWTKIKADAGWASELLLASGPEAVPPLRDSYAELGSGLLKHLVRAKPAYRTVAPVPDTHGPKQIPAEDGDQSKHPITNPAAKPAVQKPHGYSIYSLCEVVDESVIKLVREAPGYAPPNLLEYADRMGDDALMTALSTKPSCHHHWAAENWYGRIVLLLWCWLAGVGAESSRHWFFPTTARCWLLVIVVAAWTAEVDFDESKLNYQSACKPLNPKRQSWLDVLYWLRALALVAFVIGACHEVALVSRLLWQRTLSLPGTGSALLETGGALFASFLVTLYFGGLPKRERRSAASPSSPGRATLLERFVILAIWSFALWLVPHVWQQFQFTSLHPDGLFLLAPKPNELEYCGHLLLLITAFFYFINSAWWVREPMNKARLGSIVSLQLRGTAHGVRKQLDTWATKLLRKTIDRENFNTTPETRAALLVQKAVGETLWRDIRGYIPIYSALMALGLWFAWADLHWQCPFLFPHLSFGNFQITVWWWVPLATGIADWTEDVIHLSYLKTYVRRVETTTDGNVSGARPVSWLPPISIIATMVKFSGLFIGMSLTILAILTGGWQLLTGQLHGGWRGGLALIGSGVVLVVFLLQIMIWITWIRQKLSGKPRSLAGT